MRLTVNRKALLDALNTVSGAAAKRTTKEHLKGVCLSASATGLRLTATDMDTMACADIPADVDGPGACILEAKGLAAFLRQGVGDVTILTLDGGIGVNGTDDRSMQVPYVAADEMPRMPDIDDADALVLPAGLLREALARVLPCAMPCDGVATKWAIQSVLFDVKNSRLELVATNMHIMAIEAIQIPCRLEVASVLVPSNMVELLLKMLKPLAATDAVRVLTRPNEVLFVAGSTRLLTRYVEGRFPPYREVLPRRPGNRVTMRAAEWLEALEAARGETRRADCWVHLTFENGACGLLGGSTRSLEFPTLNGNKAAVACDWTGGPLSIRFGYRYLETVLKACPRKGDLTATFHGAEKMATFIAPSGCEFAIMPHTA